jgi:seryl-tRNA synthetase
MSEEKIKLQNKKDSQPANFNKYRASKGININNSNNTVNEVIDMSEFIGRKEFEQFEKRIDDKFDTINSKIDNLPNILEDKIEKHVNSAKLQLIIWIVGTSIASGGLLIALLTFVAKLFGLY